MSVLPILLRLIFIALLGAMAGAAGAADDERQYEGLLLPDDFGGPVSITVELRDLRGLLVGRVKAGSPISSAASISSGEMQGEKCDFQVPLNSAMVLRFVGACRATVFEGKYYQIGRRDGGGRGTFRLTRKEPDADEDKQEGPRPAPSATTLTDCINANSRCLMACPQGDYNTEFLCSNRCRTRYKACKKAAAP